MTSRGPMTACDTYLPMIGSLPGELSEAEASALSAHVDGCAGCRRWAAELASTEWLVSEALLGAAARREARGVMRGGGAPGPVAAPLREST